MKGRIGIALLVIVPFCFIMLVSSCFFGKNTTVEYLDGEKTMVLKLHRDYKTHMPFVSYEFVYIPGGTFKMGSPEGEGKPDEHPRHEVTVDGFWMGRYEVTSTQYAEILGGSPGFSSAANCPLERITWYDAVAFCNALSERFGFSTCYSIDKKNDGKSPGGGLLAGDTKNWIVTLNKSADGFRLPFEAEWEYACRAGADTRYHWGNEMDGRYAWYEKNSGYRTHGIKLFDDPARLPNRWGLYDMTGNVAEWCYDWYSPSYYTAGRSKNPAGPGKSGDIVSRVIRGGDCSSKKDALRSASRSSAVPFMGMNTIGMRLVKNR